MKGIIMYKEVLESIQGISLYGIISICLFFIFFTGVLVWSCALKKNYLNTMGNLPLEEGNPAMPLPPPEPWTLRPLESSGDFATGDNSPSPKGVAMTSGSPPGMINPYPCRPGALTRRCERPGASIVFPPEGIFTVEGGGEGEPVSTPPAFSPMGNDPQKL
jgi:hypothetical protein